MRLDLERLLHWKQNLDWANLKNLLEKFLLLSMHWKPFSSKKLKGIADNPNNLGAVAANILLQDFQERCLESF